MTDTAAPNAPQPQHSHRPERRWRRKAFLVIVGRDAPGKWRRLSMLVSALSILMIWQFFMVNRGWTPSPGRDADIIQYVDWFLQLLLAFQLLVFILTSSTEKRGEVWLNIVIALLPAMLSLIVLWTHWFNHEVMPLTQLRIAKSFAIQLWLTVLIGFGVALLAQSRTANLQT